MKRYLLFAFDDYYPTGGWNDFRGSFDTAIEAFVDGANWPYENKQVIDSATGREIEE